MATFCKVSNGRFLTRYTLERVIYVRVDRYLGGGVSQTDGNLASFFIVAQITLALQF